MGIYRDGTPCSSQVQVIVLDLELAFMFWFILTWCQAPSLSGQMEQCYRKNRLLSLVKWLWVRGLGHCATNLGPPTVKEGPYSQAPRARICNSAHSSRPLPYPHGLYCDHELSFSKSCACPCKGHISFYCLEPWELSTTN